MAKRKRREKEARIEFYSARLKFGLPELDNIIQAQRRHGFDDRNRITLIKHDENDRISKLPDNILHFVISRLTMREAAATCILSRRWRNLWTTSASRLVFTDSNLFGRQYPQDLFRYTHQEEHDLHRPHFRMMLSANRLLPPRKCKSRSGVIQCERTKFVKRVNRVLKLRRASAMDAFTLTFPMGSESASHIDKWMKLAAAQGVTKLDLNFNWMHFYGLGFSYSDRYEFPLQRFGSSLNHLRLNCCAFDFPPHFRALSSLVSLNLVYTFLPNDNVQSILSNCLSLQWLSLSACVFPKPTILELTGARACAPLKHLNICSCDYIEEIKLHNLNEIASFELYAESEKLSVKDVPRLSRLVLHTRGAVEISGAFPHLDTLFLNHGVDGKLPNSSAFNNLKRLVFSAGPSLKNLFEVVCLLDTCPLLQQLELDMGYFHRATKPSPAHVTTVPGFLHSALRQVKIRAFESHPDQIELAKYLLKTAIALKKMKIYTTCKTYVGNGIWTFSENGRLAGTALREVYELLRKEARPSTKLLIGST